MSVQCPTWHAGLRAKGTAATVVGVGGTQVAQVHSHLQEDIPPMTHPMRVLAHTQVGPLVFVWTHVCDCVNKSEK